MVKSKSDKKQPKGDNNVNNSFEFNHCDKRKSNILTQIPEY